MMKRQIFRICLLLILVGCLFMAVGCSKDPKGGTVQPAEIDTVEKEQTIDDYTLLVYICGSDLESHLGEASKNIIEMQQADFGENINVVVQTGGSKRWHDAEISALSTDRYLIKNGEKQLIERDIFTKNFGESDTLIDFIKFGVEKYPAKKMSLILWDHGGGSVKGVCFDANYGYDGLTLTEMQTALKNTSLLVGKWDFIGFDACLMATYETASILKPYADYMIASEELEPSFGWDYKTLISKLGTNTFYDDVLNSYAVKHAKKTTYTLSAINLSEFNRVDNVIDKIAEQINFDISFVGKALSESKEFGVKSEGGNGSNLFDLGLMAKALGIDYDFSSFISATNGSAHENASGISLYFPNNKKALLEYSSICQNEKYLQFLTEYFNYVPETPIEFVKRGYNDGEKLSFTLSENSKKYIRSIGYELHAYSNSLGTNKLYCIGTDNDILFDNGVYTIDFTGNWVFIDDKLLHCNVYEETNSYTIFYALVKVNGELGRLLFTYFKSSQMINIDGYTLDGDVTSRVNNIAEGTKITIIYDDFEENNSNYIEETTITWTNDTKLSIKKLEEGYYQYIPYVIDIYGTIYNGRTATVYFDGEKVTIINIAEG